MNGAGPTPNPSTPAVGPSPVAGGPQAGLEAQALIKVKQAAMLLADALSGLKGRLNSEEGKGVLAALKALSPLVPSVEEGLGQSELASLVSGLSPVRRAPATQGQGGMLPNRPPSPMVMGGPPMSGMR